MPRVSILTLSYNKGPYLRACLDSVLEQSFQDWELVLVDDGSTDDTWEIAREYAARDARIRPLQKPHGGPDRLAETHNLALQHSHGDLIAILDGDDRWPANKLAVQVAVHAPDVLMSYGKFVLLTGDGERVGPVPPFQGVVPSETFLRYLLTHRSFMINVTLMLSREALEQVGGFQQDGSRGADMPTGLRISQLDGKVAYVPEVLGYWRQHAVQHTRSHGAFIAEYNLALSLKTLLDLPDPVRTRLGIGASDVLRSRRAMVADAYLQATRSALVARDASAVHRFARQLWSWGGPVRRAEALLAHVAAPLGLDFEPMLTAAGRLASAARR